MNKELHAHYINNSVTIENGDLNELCALAKKHQIAIYLGIIECPKDRGGHSLYASLVYINSLGSIQSVHRKLQPTYDERLTWSPGDGHGLKVHPLKKFTVGGLNCWENWMPPSKSFAICSRRRFTYRSLAGKRPQYQRHYPFYC